MRRGVLGSAVAAPALAAPAAAPDLPQAGTCRDCARKTWYFTYRPQGQRGPAVEFARGPSASYLYHGRLWGFGLLHRGGNPCR